MPSKLDNLLDAYMSGLYTRKDVLHRIVMDHDPATLSDGVIEWACRWMNGKADERTAVKGILRDQGLLR